MNIFKNRDKTLSDDLPGSGRMQRPNLKELDEALLNTAMENVRYDRRKVEPRTPVQLSEELTSHAVEFEKAVAIAEEAAKAYCATYEELTQLVDTKLESIEAQRKELQKIRATLPRIGEKDEEASSDSDPDDGSDTSISKDRVQLKSIEGPNKPLPLNRR